MAAYRFSAKVIGRSGGRSATAAAAYRAAAEITCERTGLTHDYRRRGGVAHTEILTPENAPAWASDRERLWNAAEQAERRKDAQVAREIQMNIPHELDEETRRALVREFVQEQFVSRGMVADIAIHAPHRDGDDRNHHSHVMLTLREIDSEGFNSKKQRDWNSPELLQQWRERWTDHQNRALEQAGLDVRVDHRSLQDQGIDREPEPKLGPVATQMERDGRSSHAGDDLREVWKTNAERDRREMQEIMLELQIAQEQAQDAPRDPEQSGGIKHHFDDLYASERENLDVQAADYQAQVEALSQQLESRNRIAVFWDKLRGRLGWNAELELEAARQHLEETQERAEALEMSYEQHRAAEQEQREAELERQQAAEAERNAEEERLQQEATAYSLPEDRAQDFREKQMQDYMERFKEAQEQSAEQSQDNDHEIER